MRGAGLEGAKADLGPLPRSGDSVIEPEIPQDMMVPSDWLWVSLDQIAEVQSGAAKNKKLTDADGCVERPYLSVANVQRGYLDLEQVGSMWVRENKLAQLTLQNGDVLFNEGGDKDKLGRGWVWEEQVPGCVHQNHVFRARLLTDRIRPRWLSHWGNDFGRWWFHKRGSQTTGIASINKTVLRSLPVAIPPLETQDKLLALIERDSTRSGRLRAAVSHGLDASVSLRRSILKAAFEGRLTPHDVQHATSPDDIEEALAS